MKYVKIFGIQRSGTNFVQQLLRQNYKNLNVFDNQFGWKHSVPLDEEKVREWLSAKKVRLALYNAFENICSGNRMYACIVIKNPYSWYQSIRRWEQRGRKFNVEKQYDRYNQLYKAYKDFCEGGYKETGIYRGGVVVRYEDTLRNTNETISDIAEYFGLEAKEKFKVPKDVPQSQNFTKDRKEFYLSGGIFDLSEKEAKLITELVDWELMRFYGYEPELIQEG